MPRDSKVGYEQDRLGNERKKLDKVRAQEGMSAEESSGIVEVVTADVESTLVVQERPGHAEKMHVSMVHLYNAGNYEGVEGESPVGDTASLYELELDGEGNVTSKVRRTVPVQVAPGSTRAFGYEGTEFTGAIGVESTFEGHVGVSFHSDHTQATSENPEDL